MQGMNERATKIKKKVLCFCQLFFINDWSIIMNSLAKRQAEKGTSKNYKGLLLH